MADLLIVNPNHGEKRVELPTIYITSFGHRLGPLVPTPDLSFNLRTLPCPPKNLTSTQSGLHEPLKNWLFSNPQVQSRFNDIIEAITRGIQDAEANGVSELNVGVFCERGKHRSVSFVEELKRQRFNGWDVVVRHRDVHHKRSNQHKRARHGHSHESDLALVCSFNLW